MLFLLVLQIIFSLQGSDIFHHLKSLRELIHLYMEYDCHIFSKYLICQMKSLDLDQNTRYFESEVLKYKVFAPSI